MLSLPTSIAEIDRLISTGVQESLHLEYKDSRAILDGDFRDKLTKQISAFANSDGGVVIYGVQEQGNLPVSIDNGVEHKLCSRERIESLILNGISPRIEGIRIAVLPRSSSTSICTIEIPKSFHGPHQSSDHKYYKRFNFQSVPMEDYEINDIRNRRLNIRPLVEVGISIKRRIIVHLDVSNVGERAAENVSFDLPEEIRLWAEKEGPKLFINGVKYFPPKRRFSFRYGHMPALLSESSDKPSSFEVAVSYDHSELGRRIREVFRVDLMDFWGSYTGESETYEVGQEIKNAAKTVTDAVAKLNNELSRLASIAGATGLDLSISSMRNLRHVVGGSGQFERLDPAGLDSDAFAEVLGIDEETAYGLSVFFYRGNESTGLKELPGMTEELLQKIKIHFLLQDL